MQLIHQPLDFMGQNIYNGYYVRQGADGEPEFVDREPGFPKTACNWPVTPKAFYYGIKFLTERYPLPLYITENGMSCHDNVSFDGRVHDNDRITFLDSYIGAMQRAYDEGADIRGYFLWTFLDNFEWSEGYRERFGMIYVDFMTQRRIVKDSAFWYQNVIGTNGGNLSTNQTTKEILFLDPVCTHNIWGGTRLREDFHYPVEGDDLWECWGISAHPNGDVTLRDCGFRGMKLSELWKKHPEVFGKVDSDRFPLLIKIIDAKDDLSIQVHPDDDYAKVHENGSLGKTECWYILDCKKNATIVIGHNSRTKEELSRMIHEGKWSEFIREIPIKKGDFLQIDPGTVHAIKGGTLILETQQNSDITYRVYDYGRLSNGKPRELHIDSYGWQWNRQRSAGEKRRSFHTSKWLRKRGIAGQHADHCLHDIKQNRYLLSEEETAIMCISNEQCQTRKKQHLAVYRQDAVYCGVEACRSKFPREEIHR